MSISTLFLITYLLMAMFLFVRLRAITSYSHIHCIFIALTTSFPFILKTITNSLLFSSELLVELGFLMGGVSSKEIVAEHLAKTGGSDKGLEKGDNER